MTSSPATMRAVRLSAPGTMDNLRLTTIPLPPERDGWVWCVPPTTPTHHDLQSAERAPVGVRADSGGALEAVTEGGG
ncbi:hypothetical protein CG723_14820 [Streptomyces sp. CB01635]|nr:hypothetical protein CG723_14820 [Streptomyces sp. CB01635]